MSEIQDIVGPDVNVETLGDAPGVEDSNTTTTEQAAEAPVESASDTAPRVVPLAALHEERERRKEMSREIERMRQDQSARDAKIEQRLAALVQAQQPQPPTFEENPAEHLRQQIEATRAVTMATNEQVAGWQRQQAEAAQLQAIAGAVQRHEAQMLAEKPDYHAAVEFMRRQRANEFEAMGATPESAMQQANREMVEGALINARDGKNPAAVAYRMAELRGYRPAAVANGAETLQNQQKGIAAAKSIGSGGLTEGKPSVQALLAMTDEEFASATAGNKWAKMMGG